MSASSTAAAADAPAGLRAADTLVAIARSINSDVAPDRMLEVVVRTARELLDADRATILVLDDDGRLGPDVSIARHDDLELWTRFRDMPPIPLAIDSTARALLMRGKAVVIPCAAESPLVPPEWQRAFGLQALVIAPLVVVGEPCGALVVDDARPGHAFGDTSAGVIEGIAALAAIALRHSRRYSQSAQHARTLDQLLSLATALNASPGLYRVLQTVVDGFLEVFSGLSCSVSTLADDGSVSCLASRGPGQPEPGPVSATGDWAAGLGAARDRWMTDPNGALVAPEVDRSTGLTGPGSAVVVPFCSEDRVRGFAHIRVAAGVVPTDEQIRIGVSLAGQAWLAIERARLAEDAQRRAQRMEALYGLSHEIALLPDMRLVVERLAPAVRDALGSELIDVLLCDADAARAFAARTPRAQTAALIRQWRRQELEPRPRALDGLYVVPLVVATEVIGVLRVRAVQPDRLAPDAEDFLLAIGSGIADLVSRILLRTQVEAGERELAVAEERARVTTELQEEVGRMLLAAATRIDPYAGRIQDRVTRGAIRETQQEIARTGRRLRAAVETLDILQRHADDLPGSLRQMVRAWGRAAAVDADLRLAGRAYRLDPVVEAALLRVAHEALTRVGGDSHASTVMVQVRYDAAAVELVVHDNGVHLAQRADATSRVHPALRAMQARLQDVGGTLDITDCAPQGLRITARVPAPAEKRAALATVSSLSPAAPDAGTPDPRPHRPSSRTGGRR